MTTIKIKNKPCHWLLEHFDALMLIPVTLMFLFGWQEYSALKADYVALQTVNRELQASVKTAIDEADERMNVIQRLDKTSAELAETVKSQNAALQALNAQLKAQAQRCDAQIKQEQTLRKQQNERIADIQQSIQKSKCAVPKSLFNGLR